MPSLTRWTIIVAVACYCDYTTSSNSYVDAFQYGLMTNTFPIRSQRQGQPLESTLNRRRPVVIPLILLPVLNNIRTTEPNQEQKADASRSCRARRSFITTRLWSSIEQSSNDMDSKIMESDTATTILDQQDNVEINDDNKEESDNKKVSTKSGSSSSGGSGRKLSSYRLMQDLMELASPSSTMTESSTTSVGSSSSASSAMSSSLRSSKTTDAAACKHASHILDRAHNQYFNKNNTACKPTAAMYTAAINVYGKHGQPEKAEEALFFLWQLYNTTVPENGESAIMGDLELKPNVKTYTAVIDAWGRSNPNLYPNGLKRCEDLLNEMIIMHEHNPTLFPAPNSITFDALLNAYAHQSQPFCEKQRIPERAEELLERMEDMKRKGLYTKKNADTDEGDGASGLVQPTTHSFTSVITAWAHSRRAEASERAKHILERMIELSKTQPLVTPNTYTFNTVLDSFANAAVDNNQAADDACNLLDVMERLSRIAPSGKNKGLDHLIESSTILYDNVHVQPDTITYNTVLKAYANSKADDAAHKADALLTKMRHEYEHNNNTLVKPSDVSFNSVIAAYAKHSKNMESVQRSQALLLQMIDLSKNHPKYKQHLQPSVVTFTTVMDAWAKSTVPQKAQNAWHMLQHLKELYQATGNPALQPNIISYNTVLNACAFSADFDTEERKKALLVAVGAFNELRKQRQHEDLSEMKDEQNGIAAAASTTKKGTSNVIPDEITYGMMLKVCTNLMHMGNQERTIMARKLFEEASEEGYVGSFVLRELKRAVNKKMLLDILTKVGGGPGPGQQLSQSILFPDGNINPIKLPKTWSRNVLTDRVRGKLRVARMNANIHRTKGGGGGGRKRKRPLSSNKKQGGPSSESPRAVSRYARTRPLGGESTSIGMDSI